MKNTLALRHFVLFCAFVTMLCDISACSKKSLPTPPQNKSKTQLLTAHNWQIIKEEYGNSATDLVLPADPIPINIAFRFTAVSDDNGTFISGAGNGTWALLNSETQLQLNIAADNTQGTVASSTTTTIHSCQTEQLHYYFHLINITMAMLIFMELLIIFLYND